MTSTITDTHRKIELTEVRDVIVTDIVDADGLFKRSIRILGETGGDDPGEVMEIVVSSATKADIELSAPANEY